MAGGDWNEAEHPRDEQGRFGEGGGGEKPKLAQAWARGKLGGVVSAHAQLPAVSDAKTGHDGVKAEGRTFTDKRPSHLPDETWRVHYKGNPNKGGQPTNERKTRVHDPIVHAALDHVSVPPKGAKKIAIMTMGGPASGKGTILRGMDKTKFVNVDPDAVKGKLPEYRDAIKDRKNTFKGAAAMAHEESSAVARRIRDEAIAQGKHVIIDGTGASAEKFMKLMDHLKSKGYEVHVHMPHLSVQQGLVRAKERASGSGRYVPDKFVIDTYDKIHKSVDQIRAKADNFHMYDGENGHKKMFSKVNGKETVHDPAAMKRFGDRHEAHEKFMTTDPIAKTIERAVPKASEKALQDRKKERGK